MLKHTKGNLLDLAEAGEFDIVVQGCNCFNTMGGGIAREIRERYPYAARIDAETKKGDYNKLGNWTESEAGDYFDTATFSRNNKFQVGDPKRFTIINAYTQYNMSQGTDVFEYTAFELILQKLIHTYGNKRMGFPYIGMGLAGGDKETIMAMLEDFAQGVSAAGGTVTLVEFG
jgi:O-acetyl-ADP-ribose deacetylase (regulator of RNase III)